MKHLKFWMTALMVAIIGIGFTACGGDDDEPGNNVSVVGTWYGYDYDNFYSNVSINFYSNGTGTATMERNGSYTSIYRATFTYTVKGNKVTTSGTMANGNSDGESSTQSFDNTYELRGNTLVVTGGNNWYTNCVKSYMKR